MEDLLSLSHTGLYKHLGSAQWNVKVKIKVICLNISFPTSYIFFQCFYFYVKKKFKVFSKKKKGRLIYLFNIKTKLAINFLKKKKKKKTFAPVQFLGWRWKG